MGEEGRAGGKTGRRWGGKERSWRRDRMKGDRRERVVKRFPEMAAESGRGPDLWPEM